MYCRYCYGQGHNKRSCPKLKEFIAANPTSYLADTFKRHCSYCRDEGHTSATCEKLKEANRQERIEILEAREGICEKLAKMGIMPGTLMRAEFYNTSKRTWVYEASIVNNVDWQNIRRRPGNCLSLVSCASGEQNQQGLPSEYSEMYRVLCPMPYEKSLSYNRSQMEKTNDKIFTEKKNQRGGRRRR